MKKQKKNTKLNLVLTATRNRVYLVNSEETGFGEYRGDSHFSPRPSPF